LPPEHVAKAGEFLVAFLLEKKRIECHIVGTSGSDIWVRLVPQDGSDPIIKTVQVKTASKIRKFNGQNRGGSYEFCLSTKRDSDIYAFVALDRDLVLFYFTKEVKVQSKLRIHKDEYTPKNMESTLNQCFFNA